MLQQTLWWYIATLPRGTQINVSRLGHIWPVECIEMNKNCFRFSTERHIQQLQWMQGKSWASGPTCLKSPSRRGTKVQNHWPKKPLMLVRTSVTNGSIHFGIPFGIPKMLIQKLTKLFQSLSSLACWIPIFVGHFTYWFVAKIAQPAGRGPCGAAASSNVWSPKMAMLGNLINHGSWGYRISGKTHSHDSRWETQQTHLIWDTVICEH